MGREVDIADGPLERLELETRVLEARRRADRRTRAKQEEAARVLSEVRRQLSGGSAHSPDVLLLSERS